MIKKIRDYISTLFNAPDLFKKVKSEIMHKVYSSIEMNNI